MTKRVYWSTYWLLISILVYTPGTSEDTTSINASHVPKESPDSFGGVNLRQECDCGDHGSCRLEDDVVVCHCDKNYALKSLKCEPCDCGKWSEKCSFNSRGEKVCQCPKGFASKTATWSSYGTWCEICNCNEHARCRWKGNEEICDCDEGYKLYQGKCIECDCGQYGTCELDGGFKVCSCDYGYAEKDGTCQVCDCNLVTRRYSGINCTFINGLKQCICPKGFKARSEYCEDINECFEEFPCPTNALCINKPGTFECKCREGFEPIAPSWSTKLSGCEDVDECLQSPCESPATRCVNSPGSYDCACKEGYYSTSGNKGSSYNPAHNECYEIETQWREATIALGVVMSTGIIGILSYINKHYRST